MKGSCYSIEVQPRIPAPLSRLTELADDLFYSWSTDVRALFYYLQPELWVETGHRPKLFLRRISQQRLDEAAEDPIFLGSYHLALTDYDNYLAQSPRADLAGLFDLSRDLVAYFSMEFGFHESVPIYSGGLGILAGDHCKAASDLGLPLVAVGLLYRQGYFNQLIDSYGNQQADYPNTDFSQLPISPARDVAGNEIIITLDETEEPISLRVWQAKVGRIRLYLLDSDVEQNSARHRTITHQLYGGDSSTRILQEMVLGIGGVRALRALGLAPTAWHINEGHGAFQVVERCREKIGGNIGFNAALEMVAKNTVFTTHTPVAAGHDIFTAELVLYHFERMIGELGIAPEHFLSLGSSTAAQGGFNMTALALRGTRFHNGVSRIHGQVSSEMESYIWPQIAPHENPIGYVTNGVHVYSVLAPEWRNLFDMEFGHEWRNQLLNTDYWERIDEIPDYRYWSIRQTLKSQLFKDVATRIRKQQERNGDNPVDIEQSLVHLNPSNTRPLVIGFARRFATYKRATLILSDLERLARLVNDPERPLVFIFAGKAHPSDHPGQELIRKIFLLSRQKEFLGKIILLEGYNMAMTRRLVSGVDVWLNTPEYPLEASGTSGQKAGLNGVINLSVLDGWWGEGFNGENGWAISPHPNRPAAERDEIEAQTALDLLEYQIIPTYFDWDGQGYSAQWVKVSKASMKSILPRYNAQRMVMDYVRGYYTKAIEEGKSFASSAGEPAVELADWKERVHEGWPRVSMRRLDDPIEQVAVGEPISIRMAVELGELDPEDVTLECQVGTAADNGELQVVDTLRMVRDGRLESGEALFSLDFTPPLPGLQYYKLRLYPYHPMLTHPYEMGCMIWQ